jgi:hypothetical protein
MSWKDKLLAAISGMPDTRNQEVDMGLTTDRHDGCLHDIDPKTGMQHCYLVLPDGERRNLVRPVRRSYLHQTCGSVTTMGQAIAETYAANPGFYGGTMCVRCRAHFPVGADGEFTWIDSDGNDTGDKVGT